MYQGSKDGLKGQGVNACIPCGLLFETCIAKGERRKGGGGGALPGIYASGMIAIGTEEIIMTRLSCSLFPLFFFRDFYIEGKAQDGCDARKAVELPSAFVHAAEDESLATRAPHILYELNELPASDRVCGAEEAV